MVDVKAEKKLLAELIEVTFKAEDKT